MANGFQPISSRVVSCLFIKIRADILRLKPRKLNWLIDLSKFTSTDHDVGKYRNGFKVKNGTYLVYKRSYFSIVYALSFQPLKHVPHGSKPGTQQRDRSISSVSVHSSGRPKSSLSTLTDKGSPEPAIEEVSEEPSVLEQEIKYEEQVRLVWEILLKWN